MCSLILPAVIYFHSRLPILSFSASPPLPLFPLLHLKKSFLQPDLHQEALNHQRPLLSQPQITPVKACYSVRTSAHMHRKRLCILHSLLHACSSAVHVCVRGYTQQEARGASQRKWVFVKKKAQIGAPNTPPGREDRSMLARSLCVYKLSHTQTRLDAQLQCCY